VITGDTVVTPRPGLVVEGFDDALLIWDGGRRQLHHLDLLAAVVWDELDGRSLAAVAADLAADFGAPAAAIRDDLVTLSERLVADHLLEADVRTTSHAIGRGPRPI
jgi:hypothetical protein